MNKLFPQHSDHPLFRYFTEAERRRIEKIGEVKTVRADEFLIRARDRDSTLFTVEEGHLDIVGKDSVLATVGPGDVLGEVSFIDDSPRTVSVRAGEENASSAAGRRSRCPKLSRPNRNCCPSSQSRCASYWWSDCATPRGGCSGSV